jgi:hypothetical protein
MASGGWLGEATPRAGGDRGGGRGSEAQKVASSPGSLGEAIRRHRRAVRRRLQKPFRGSEDPSGALGEAIRGMEKGVQPADRSPRVVVEADRRPGSEVHADCRPGGDVQADHRPGSDVHEDARYESA